MKCSESGCRANSLRDDKYCYFHSQRPEVVEKRQEARKRGGSRGKVQKADSIETIEDIKQVLAEAINELRSCGTGNTVGKARAIGYLCGVMLTAFEKYDLEERIAKLEEMLTTSTT